MNVLIACEFSGVVREAFAAKGHNAWSCDLLPTEIPGQHHEKDITEVMHWNWWDMIIAHPPCTYLCNSGVRWLHSDPSRWGELHDAVTFFRLFTENHCPKVVIENPIPHKYAANMIGPKYDQLIQPWQFGHGETKATCLWLKGVDPLGPSNVVDGRKPVVHHMSPGPERSKLRSITYQGIADAMAEQWG